MVRRGGRSRAAFSSSISEGTFGENNVEKTGKWFTWFGRGLSADDPQPKPGEPPRPMLDMNLASHRTPGD